MRLSRLNQSTELSKQTPPAAVGGNIDCSSTLRILFNSSTIDKEVQSSVNKMGF